MLAVRSNESDSKFGSSDAQDRSDIMSRWRIRSGFRNRKPLFIPSNCLFPIFSYSIRRQRISQYCMLLLAGAKPSIESAMSSDLALRPSSGHAEPGMSYLPTIPTITSGRLTGREREVNRYPARPRPKNLVRWSSVEDRSRLGPRSVEASGKLRYL